MFDILNSSYKKIISNIGIIGYLEEDINNCNSNEYNKIPLNCLYAFPSKNESTFNSLTYEMMFPNGERYVDCPKFFTLSLTDEKANHSFLYCLKFSEKYKIKPQIKSNEEIMHKKKIKSEEINFNKKYKEIYIPIVICIQSEKNDSEPFRQLLYAIHQIIINDNFDNDKNVVNDYKKIELMNLLYFLFSLPHTSPHTLISLKLNYNKNINNNSLNDNETFEYDLIDFYFSSNCEIPCNKYDTNIDLLFKILDQTIIIKVLFAILTEKQIILRASEPYLLHIIIPTFLKLMFPFKWIQTCITILPKENIDYLDIPGTYIIGILSDTIQVKEILKEYPGKIIVDCDTNEIIGEEISEPFYPKEINNNNNKKKEEKEKSNSNGTNNDNDGIYQGKNTFIVEGCYLYECDPNLNNKNKNLKKKLKINSKNNIIIDVKTSQLLMSKNDSYLNSDEWKWLRKNIQMVRNPEIFDIGNIMKRKRSIANVFFENSKMCPIIPERPFSYNIQNILMTFLLNKLKYPESDFMIYFKNSNLYLNYIEPKKYQNNSGKYIVENIHETINNQRSCNNCFIIEYNLNPFNANIFVEEFDKKINDIEKQRDINNNINININLNNKDNEKINFYKKLRKVFMAYCVVLGISMKQMNDIINENNLKSNKKHKNHQKSRDKHNNRFNLKSSYFSINNINSNNFMIKEHIKNKKTEFCNNINNADCDDDYEEEENFLSFYGDNGFLYFINNFEKYLRDEDIDIIKIIYQNSINSQIINILKDLKQLLQVKETSKVETEIIIDMLDNDFTENNNNSINEEENINNNTFLSPKSKMSNHKSSLDFLEEIKSKSSSKILDNKSYMSIVEEKKEEEVNDSFLEGIISKKSTKKINNCEYDLENCMNNKDKDDEEDNILKNNNINNNYKNGNIIDFPEFNYEKENELNIFDNNINNRDKIDLLSQYYLFINYYLEEISKDDSIKNQVIEEIKKMYGIQLNFEKLILKIYKLAFEHSGKKHRDFPYFTFYEFLMGLSFEDLKKLENNIDKFQLELYDIYNKVCKEKKTLIEKEKQSMSLLYNSTPRPLNLRSASIGIFENKNTIIQEDQLKMSKTVNAQRASLIIKPNISEDLIKMRIIKPDKSNKSKKNDNINIINEENQSQFIHSKEYIINNSSDFDPYCEPGSTHILHELCVLISTCLPNKEDIQNKNIEQILEETNIKLNTQTFRELIGELRIIDLSQLSNNKSKICFWLNCFNFLLLYTIFYKKWNISDEKSWKSFFKNVKYNISGNYFSFNDMQYIIFQKIYFFSSNYKPADFVKENMIDNNKIKSFNNNPFALYLPTKELFNPIIYEENKIEKSLKIRKINYINSFLQIDNNKVNITELFLTYEPNFFNNKVLNKYKDIIIRSIYDFILKKKYSDINTKSLKWEMNFDYLYEEINHTTF